MHVQMCMQCNAGQKRALDALELELETVVSHLVGVENQTLGFSKSSKWS